MQNETNQGHKKTTCLYQGQVLKGQDDIPLLKIPLRAPPPVSNLNYCYQDRNKKHKKHKNVPLLLDPDRQYETISLCTSPLPYYISKKDL